MFNFESKVSALVTISASIAFTGYALYRYFSSRSQKLGQEEYYDGREEFTFFNIINRTPDLTGNGVYPELVEEVCPLSGRKYKRGNPMNDLEPLELRNQQMWGYVQENMPMDRKIRAIELGAGRGSLTRYVALKLQQMDKLELMMAVNLSQKENLYNLKNAIAAGIPEDKFETVRLNFDDLSSLEDGSFDVIMSNYALLHASDKTKLCKEMARILSKGGVAVYSDCLLQKGVTEQEVPKLMERFHLKSLWSLETYDSALRAAGLKKIMLYGDKGYSTFGHFGMQLYTATVYKKNQLLGPSGVSQKFYDWKIMGIHEWLDYGEKGQIEEGWFIYKKE